MAGGAAEVVELLRVGREVEQLRREILEEHVFPALGAHHVAARALGRQAERAARVAERKVAVAEGGVTPAGRLCAIDERYERATLETVRLGLAARPFEESRREVDGLGQIVYRSAAHRVRLG